MRSVVRRRATALRAERWGNDSTWTCLHFHHITDGRRFRADDPLIRGLGVDISVEKFVAVLDYAQQHYDIVGLDAAAGERRGRDRPPLLLTFDDAFASVAEVAAPILRERGLPWMFLINPGMLDARRVAMDHLLAYVANTAGRAGLRRVFGHDVLDLHDAVMHGLRRVPLQDEPELASRAASVLDCEPHDVPGVRDLYLTSRDVRDLVADGVEIGNHTRDHVHCRKLDEEQLRTQICDSASEIAALTGHSVRSFAMPYGSIHDGTPAVRRALRESGHEYVFYVEGRLNTRRIPADNLYRITVKPTTAEFGSWETAVLPRVRAALAAPRGRRPLREGAVTANSY